MKCIWRRLLPQRELRHRRWGSSLFNTNKLPDKSKFATRALSFWREPCRDSIAMLQNDTPCPARWPIESRASSSRELCPRFFASANPPSCACSLRGTPGAQEWHLRCRAQRPKDLARQINKEILPFYHKLTSRQIKIWEKCHLFSSWFFKILHYLDNKIKNSKNIKSKFVNSWQILDLVIQ